MAANGAATVPFPASCALNTDCLRPPADGQAPDNPATAPRTYLPGNPDVSLCSDAVHAHIAREFATPLLDELYDRLWCVAQRSSRNINPLNMQRVKERAIIPTEDPNLHLTWKRDAVYIKPVPVYLLNHDFWALFLSPGVQDDDEEKNVTHDAADRAAAAAAAAMDRATAVGFLRSYALLVASPLDFALAREAHLLPDAVDNWCRWAHFIRHFRGVGDEHVARRYHYGQLRLSRLDWAVRLFQPRHARSRLFYKMPFWSTVVLVEKMTLPLVFVFASLSVALSSMQVALSVPAASRWAPPPAGLEAMARVFWGFSVAVVVLLVAVSVLLIGVPLSLWIWQMQWGFRNRRPAHPVDTTADDEDDDHARFRAASLYGSGAGV
ncbi:hypothetical protein SPI_02750 [Niveomyces insectorum RCEF 264]|uniref:Subtilisin-like serine protease n=1 Tax=Niveomyces insectorum RCEF 264 TaxID=1081102 RepID=A0A167Y857_9HYPO|nr:hypothetical protein SPI_02750 [Niveomyces insectorum RCEF 264]